ncbi:MAG: hypothetical protein K2H89_01580 [Oscillospiraceae bacterium]|nr:hypothetical protein [Oscillospiraceae bacterium]
MTEKKKSFLLYVDRKKELDLLSNEQLGQLFRAIYDYVDTGTKPDFNDLALCILFSVFQSQIDANAEKYKEKCEKNKKIAIEREARKRERMYTKSTDTDTVTGTDTVTDTVTDIDTVTNTDLSGDKSPEPPVRDGDAKKKSPLLAMIQAYTQNPELQNALAGFVEMRKQIKKPLTERAMQFCLKKLDQLASIT